MKESKGWLIGLCTSHYKNWFLASFSLRIWCFRLISFGFCFGAAEHVIFGAENRIVFYLAGALLFW